MICGECTRLYVWIPPNLPSHPKKKPRTFMHSTPKFGILCTHLTHLVERCKREFKNWLYNNRLQQQQHRRNIFCPTGFVF